MKKIFKINLLILTLIAIPFISLCQNNVKTEKFDLSNFTSISVSDDWNVYITQGKEYNVEVKANEKYFKNLDISVVKNELIIENEKAVSIEINKSGEKKVKDIYITIPKLKELSCSGSSDVYFKNEMKCDDLIVSLSGSSDINDFKLSCKNLDINCSGSSDAKFIFSKVNNITVRASGSSDVDLKNVSGNKLTVSLSGSADLSAKGKVNSMDIKAMGNSEIEAYQLEAKNCIITLSGNSDAEIFVTENLNANLSGMSDLTCKGNPKQVVKNTTSMSDIKIY